MSTHAIGPVRLLLGSLLLMFVGALAFWWFWGRLGGEAALVIRDGSFEVEPWVGTMRSSGADLIWDHQPTDVEIAVYRSTDNENELTLGEPTRLSGVRTIRVDFRLEGTLGLSDAVVVTWKSGPLTLTAKGGQLVRRGDVWAHQGFVSDGRRQRFEIAKIELLGPNDDLLGRYQNPDQGRRVRFRLKLLATGGS